MNFTITALLAVGLVACGGGGSSAPAAPTPVAPTTPIAVTTTNAPAVAATAISGVTNVSLSSGSLIAADTTVATVPPRTLGRISVAAAKRAQEFLSGPQGVTGVVQTTNCAVSGSVTINAADNGTSVSITFNNCSDYAGEVMNGTLSISNITDNGSQFTGTFSINLTFTASGYPTVRIVGGYSISMSYTVDGLDNIATYTATFAGTSFSVIEGSNVTTLSSFSFSESYVASTGLYTFTANYTLAATEIGGSVTVETTVPFQQYGYRNYPFAGQLVATGTGNSKVRVTILGDETHALEDVQIEVDADGINGYEMTILKDWNEL